MIVVVSPFPPPPRSSSHGCSLSPSPPPSPSSSSSVFFPPCSRNCHPRLISSCSSEHRFPPPPQPPPVACPPILSPSLLRSPNVFALDCGDDGRRRKVRDSPMSIFNARCSYQGLFTCKKELQNHEPLLSLKLAKLSQNSRFGGKKRVKGGDRGLPPRLETRDSSLLALKKERETLIAARMLDLRRRRKRPRNRPHC